MNENRQRGLEHISKTIEPFRKTLADRVEQAKLTMPERSCEVANQAKLPPPLIHRNFAKGNWSRIQNEVVHEYFRKIGPDAIAIYMVLVCFSRNDKVEGLSAEKLKKFAGICRERVFAALNVLEKHGLIRRLAKPGHENSYIVCCLRGSDRE